MVGFVKRTLTAGVPFGVIMALPFGLISGDATRGVVIGAVSGAVFGPTMSSFVEVQRRKSSTQDSTLEGERLLKEGPVNHFRRGEGVGGYLYLTEGRLLFRSHGFNVQDHELSIPLEDVLEVRACMTAFVVPNGLRISIARGTERFVVEGRRSWIDAIRDAQSAAERPVT